MGRGTFGKVKLGTHVRSNEKVAIKILDKQKIKDQSDLERINREIKILKKLRHPNVVQLFEIIENERYLYLIMEYCSGDQIMKSIRKSGRLKEADACRFFQQIISGVEYIHKLGIVHRDIKPENILLDHNNNIKLVDFGLGNLYQIGSMLKTACGSPCYAAPEMTKGHVYHGIMTDIWSSGVVLYVMVTGQLPFQDRNTNKLYQKIQTASYTMPEYLSDTCKDFIRRILVPDWNQRYRIEDIRAHPWYNQVLPHEKDGILLDKQQVDIDDKILVKLEKDYQVDLDKVKQELRQNKFTPNTTIYYLLLKRQERVNLMKQQFSLDLNKKKQKVNVQMVLDQQNQNNQVQNPQEEIKVQQNNANGPLDTQKLEIPIRQRADHSTDVNRTFAQPIMKPNMNFMSTINPELQTGIHPNLGQTNPTVDPFSKINNPKARKLIENLDRQTKPSRGGDRKHDSTGGSEYAEYNSYHQAAQLVPNARNAGVIPQYNSVIPSSNLSQNTSNERSLLNPALTAGQTQIGFYQQTSTTVNSGRQQIPSPSYQNYLFSEKITPSHYRSPIQVNPMFTQASSINPVVSKVDRTQYIKTGSIKPQLNRGGIQPSTRPQEIIQSLVSQTNSAQKKYRSASRSNDQNQSKIVKKQGTGIMTPSQYVKQKVTAIANSTTMNFNKSLNQSFQDGRYATNFNDSMDMDIFFNPSLMGKTQINFAKANTNVVQSRALYETKKFSPVPSVGRQNSPYGLQNLSFQIGQPNQTIIIRNPPQAHHVKHNSFSGGAGATLTHHAYYPKAQVQPKQMININDIVGQGSGNNTGLANFKKFLNQTQELGNPINATPEEIANLYANQTAAQRIIKGKRSGVTKDKQTAGYNLNQTFY